MTKPAYPPISIVICTRDRPEQLARCLASIRQLNYPVFETLVVDNAPQGPGSAAIAEAAGAHYVREDCPGLNWARNRGIAEAGHIIIAYTDDDTEVDRNWLRAIADTFRDPDVMAVTGLVLAAELETVSQHLFEGQYGGMGRGRERRVLCGSELSERQLLMAHTYGVGANMAFRRSLFEAIGTFDVALDVGTPSGGGGDNEMFHRLLAHGYTLVYEPTACVRHWHRRNFADLQKLVFNNGRTIAAFWLTSRRNRTVGRAARLRFLIGFWFKYWLIGRLINPDGFPRRLVLAEFAGTVIGVPAYFLARERARMLSRVRASPSRQAQGDADEYSVPARSANHRP
jgi:glycosyltransferase involved in cell wall biosynthesis